MNPIRKIVAGDDFRKTRLHDSKGNFIDRRAWSSLPKAAGGWLAMKLFDRRPALPWLAYNVITRFISRGSCCCGTG